MKIGASKGEGKTEKEKKVKKRRKLGEGEHFTGFLV